MHLGRAGAVIVMLAGTAWAGSRDPKVKEGREATKPRAGGAMLGVLRAPRRLSVKVDRVSGGLTTAVVQRTVQARVGRLRTCVAREPSLQGKLLLTLGVSAKGAATIALRGGTLKRPAVEACLIRGLARLVFPAGAGRARLTLRVHRSMMLGSLSGGVIAGGGIGLRGSGGGTPPEIRSKQPIIGRGPLPREVIQRVIRTHLGEVRRCYEQQLVKQPGLAGRVVVGFTIAADGTVTGARLSSSSVASPAVGQCLVRRVLTWLFPRPMGGGIVKVSYPFVFRASDKAPTKPKPPAEAPPPRP